ncbi:AAA family ATPase [Terasakiella sp. A23]|uniref:AAA family ATPase n=1 Tax=Terasakiella sp. FCG-A23 TaxID=3080561 RepID=UPI002952BCA3|nr:AAA family ATPase [Terasakiella sp. A23]MDV7339459.1 AAA family ATPase [Terasakiella sp. A23]
MLKAPFLKKISLVSEKIDKGSFPFNVMPYLNDEFELHFDRTITFFVGENGSGKSTMLEAIAKMCGYHESGGSLDHVHYESSDHTESALAKAMKSTWLPKVRQGFFFRSESFFNLANYIDTYGDLDKYYGGQEMHKQSHGEAFLSLFSNRLGAQFKSTYLLDEPEAALSPQRQLTFLSLLSEWEKSGNAQLIIATHSPILLAYPNARIIEFTADGLRDVAYEETEHFKITKTFLNNPRRYLRELMD